MTNIVKWLKHPRPAYPKNGLEAVHWLDKMKEAADALDAKDKEIERLRALVEHYEKMVGHPNHVKSMATRHDPHKMKSATTQED